MKYFSFISSALFVQYLQWYGTLTDSHPHPHPNHHPFYTHTLSDQCVFTAKYLENVWKCCQSQSLHRIIFVLLSAGGMFVTFPLKKLKKCSLNHALFSWWTDKIPLPSHFIFVLYAVLTGQYVWQTTLQKCLCKVNVQDTEGPVKPLSITMAKAFISV